MSETTAPPATPPAKPPTQPPAAKKGAGGPASDGKVPLVFLGGHVQTFAVGPQPQTFHPQKVGRVDPGLKEVYLSMRDQRTKQPLFRDPLAKEPALAPEPNTEVSEDEQ